MGCTLFMKLAGIYLVLLERVMRAMRVTRVIPGCQYTRWLRLYVLSRQFLVRLDTGIPHAVLVRSTSTSSTSTSTSTTSTIDPTRSKSVEWRWECVGTGRREVGWR